jgi:hypothetical protein
MEDNLKMDRGMEDDLKKMKMEDYLKKNENGRRPPFLCGKLE